MIEKITKLLDSAVWEDVLLGIELMVNNLNPDEVKELVRNTRTIIADSPYTVFNSLYFISGNSLYRVFDGYLIESIHLPGQQDSNWTKL